jgi:hypothetical protein
MKQPTNKMNQQDYTPSESRIIEGKHCAALPKNINSNKYSKLITDYLN